MSENTVIDFPKEEESYWLCNCGCMTHYVRISGEIECGSCETIIGENGEWVHYPPTSKSREINDETADEDLPYDNIIGTFLHSRFISRARDGEFVVLIGIEKSGTVSISKKTNIIETVEQRHWFRKCLRDAYKLVVRK